MFGMKLPTRRQRAGFTLVELMVVIGILVVLLSLLLPTLSRVRESVKQASCMSNLRQLGVATMAYLVDSDGYFPRPAGGGATNEDWVYWETSRISTKQQGRLVKYLGAGWETAIRCPSDSVGQHPAGGDGRYAYSYTINESMAHSTGVARPAGQMGTLLLRQVKKPGEKILFIDESGETVDDGCWAPQNYASDGRNLLSNRHDRQKETSTDPNAGRGNVTYADGHAEYIQRGWSVQRKNWDAEIE
jgi:prepilin-type N-terminal cleavage/methylation domain-containing protein/prepilin-type processing-associated H-X9-DG protein